MLVWQAVGRLLLLVLEVKFRQNPLPREVSQDIAAVLKLQDVIDQMNKVGNIPAPNTPAEFDKIIRADTERYALSTMARSPGSVG